MTQKRLCYLLALGSGLMLATTAVLSAAWAGSALLSLDPPTIPLAPGETVSMTIHLESSTAASGVDIHLAYDPALLLVLDAGPLTDTVEISPGTCPEPDFVIRNEANVVSGTIQYAVVAFGPDAGCLSGEVATIQFQCVGLGTSEVIFTSETELSDSNGMAISFTFQNASVTCSDESATPTPTPTPTPTATKASPNVHFPIIRNAVPPTPIP